VAGWGRRLLPRTRRGTSETWASPCTLPNTTLNIDRGDFCCSALMQGSFPLTWKTWKTPEVYVRPAVVGMISRFTLVLTLYGCITYKLVRVAKEWVVNEEYCYITCRLWCSCLFYVKSLFEMYKLILIRSCQISTELYIYVDVSVSVCFFV